MNNIYYVSKQLSKAKGKIYESYVINRIYHLINRVDLQIITQQYVRRPNGYALTDLYLPQLSLHIEVDEPHHEKQLIADIDREADIVEATEHQIRRITITENIDEVNIQVDELCAEINQRISELKQKSEWIPWTYELEFDFSKYRNQGYISADQNTVFKTILDGCNFMGQDYDGAQKVWYRSKKYDNHILWFPKFYENDKWDNYIVEDRSKIISYCKDESIRIKHYEDVMNKRTDKHITFPRTIDSLGFRMYKFAGVFELDKEESSPEKGLIFNAVASKFDL